MTELQFKLGERKIEIVKAKIHSSIIECDSHIEKLIRGR